MWQERTWNVLLHLYIGANPLKLPLPWDKPMIHRANLGQTCSVKPTCSEAQPTSLLSCQPAEDLVNSVNIGWGTQTSHRHLRDKCLCTYWKVYGRFLFFPLEWLLGPMGEIFVYSFMIDCSSYCRRSNLCLVCSHDTQIPGVQVFPSGYLPEA